MLKEVALPEFYQFVELVIKIPRAIEEIKPVCILNIGLYIGL